MPCYNLSTSQPPHPQGFVYRSVTTTVLSTINCIDLTEREDCTDVCCHTLSTTNLPVLSYIVVTIVYAVHLQMPSIDGRRPSYGQQRCIVVAPVGAEHTTKFTAHNKDDE